MVKKRKELHVQSSSFFMSLKHAEVALSEVFCAKAVIKTL